MVKSYDLLISDLVLIFVIWSCCWLSATWTWHRCDLKRLGLPSMWFTSSESYADLSLWWGHLKACATKGNCMQPAMWLGDTRGCSGFITQKGMSLGGRHSKHDFSSLVLLGRCWKFFQEPGQSLLLNMSYLIGQQGLPRGNGSVLTLCWRLVAKNQGVERCGFRTAFLPKSRHGRPGMHANCDDPCVMQNSIMHDQGNFGMVRGRWCAKLFDKSMGDMVEMAYQINIQDESVVWRYIKLHFSPVAMMC